MNLTNYTPPTAILSEELEAHPRHPFLAAGLALLCPGLGHLYVGRQFLAITLVVLGLVVGNALGLLFAWLWAASLVTYGFIVALGVGLWLAQAGHAFALAAREHDYRLASFNHVPTYVVFALVYAIPAIGSYRAQSAFVAEVYTVENAAMSPLVLPGDQLFVSKLGSHDQYGDIVVYERHFDAATTAHTTEVGRVLGREGDLLEATDGVWRRNGGIIDTRQVGSYELLNRSNAGHYFVEEAVTFERIDMGMRYQVLRAEGWKDRLELESFGPIEVPPGHVFIVGDNLEGSWDSRKFGAIRLSKIVGRPTFVWGSTRPERFEIDRTGLRIE